MVHEPKRTAHLFGVDTDVLPAGCAGFEVHPEPFIHGPVAARQTEQVEVA